MTPDEKQILIEHQLLNLYELSIENRFNPYDLESFKFAHEDRLLVVDGTAIYQRYFLNDKEVKQYLFETDAEKKIFSRYFNLVNKVEINNDYLKNYWKTHYWHCFIKDIKRSPTCYNGYYFSYAQLKLIKHFTEEQKLLLANIVLSHFKNKNKKYQLKQEIFYNFCNIDSDYFTELCYAKNLQEEQDIVFDFDLSAILLNNNPEILNKFYYSLYPLLKNKIIKRLKELN